MPQDIARTEKEFWQNAEDKEQIAYLWWHAERCFLKNALGQDKKENQKYRLMKRVCRGYLPQDIKTNDLADALDALFVINRRSSVSRDLIQNKLAASLSSATMAQLKKTQEQIGNFVKTKRLVFNEDATPLFVAHTFAQFAMEDKVMDSIVSPMDIAIQFGLLARNPKWHGAIKNQFQKLAVDMAQHQTDHVLPAYLKSWIWKEMHDIIVKDHPTTADFVHLEMVGMIGQRYGIDLEQRLLDAHQDRLNVQPEERQVFNSLKEIQKRRHSIWGRMGLFRSKTVR